MNARFVCRLQGMFEGSYKEVRGIYQVNPGRYSVVVWTRYLGSYRSVETALAVRDLWIYTRKLNVRRKTEGRGWDKYILVPAHSESYYRDMMRLRKKRSFRSLLNLLQSDRTEAGRPKS